MKARSWSATVEVETLSAVPHSTHITSSSMSGSEACGAAPVAKTSEHEQRRQQPHAFSPSSGWSVRSSHFWSTGPRRCAAIRPRRSTTNVSGKAREP